MLFFICFLLATNMLVAQLFGFIYANTSAIYTLLALLIFVAVAMMFLQETRKYSGIAFFIAVLLYASIGILAPFT